MPFDHEKLDVYGVALEFVTLAHSILGSFVYGVFAVKIFFVHDTDHPRWTLPLVGGTLFAVLTTLWLTSAYWYFTEVRFGV